MDAELPLSAFNDDANLYFVHGYNMAQHEAREWAQAVYKRLWWAGFRGKFHAVTWYSNDSQFKMPSVGYVCPNYHANVEHAFASASNLAAVVSRCSGPNYFLAHSLGNMLVSAAIQDWQMSHEKYFMLNAAVPIEAYDTSTNAVNAETIERMTPSAWVGHESRLRASHWFETAGIETNDARRILTWKARFASVANVVNYYSSEDEVLKCGYGEYHHPMQREWAWYNQERIKGVKPLEMGLGRNEGGWGFNPNYDIPCQEWDSDLGMYVVRYRPPTAAEANSLTNDFRVEPFFGKFKDTTLFTTNYLVPGTIGHPLRAQLLADAIPAESLPVGFSPVLQWIDIDDEVQSDSGNIDIASEFKDLDYLNVLDENMRKWRHSYFLATPFMIVHPLYQSILKTIKKGKVL